MAGTSWVAIAGGALVLALVAVGLLLLRVQRLGNRVGSFECARRPGGDDPWTSGIAVFGAGRVDWWRLVSWAPTPTASWRRADLEVLGRRRRGPEGAGAVVEAHIRHLGEEFELAMMAESFAALVSWLEAAPPHDPTDRGPLPRGR